jgi:methylmalonyl-CoA/ethylmalonyl-CoA epimerase
MKSNWEHNHSGIFARDLEETVRYYQSLGLATVLPPSPQGPPPSAGKAVNIEFGQVVNNPSTPERPFLKLIYIGDLELEVLRAPEVRPEGEALSYGEGINHACFSVPDIDGETQILVNKGLRIIQDFKLDGVRLEDYLDTRKYGNFLLSLRTLQTEEAKKRKADNAIIDWKFQGHTAVVKDVEKTTEYYESLGIATVQPQTIFDSSTIDDVKVYGKSIKGNIKAKTRKLQISTVVYELVQPVEGESIYKESLDMRGEGIIDLTYKVDNLDMETAKLVAKGVPVIFSGKPRKGSAFAYFDTRKNGGDALIKLVQR